MKQAPLESSLLPPSSRGGRRRGLQGLTRAAAGFTLVELLMVIVIIGILAVMGLPALKGLGQSNLTAAAHRQILDDLALARLRAINSRTTVYVVFVSPSVVEQAMALRGNQNEQIKKAATNLVPLQFTGYAMIAARSVGDQPGQNTARYLTDWKQLPDGFLFAPFKFDASPRAQQLADPNLRSFTIKQDLPFPRGTGPLLIDFPAIGFNAQGQMVSGKEETIALARGTIMFQRDQNDRYVPQSLNAASDVVLTPPPKSTNDYQFVSINYLTGRARAQSTRPPP
jgi:prepilin-type N-terminal cleavage/methylation domain-containing protein